MYTPIKLDKVRNFRFGMKAIDIIEKTFKCSIAKLDLDDLTMEQTAVIMCAGLQHEDKELTPDRVMDLIDTHSNLTEALGAMGEAFKTSFGSGEPQGKKKRTEKNSVSG